MKFEVILLVKTKDEYDAKGSTELDKVGVSSIIPTSRPHLSIAISDTELVHCVEDRIIQSFDLGIELE